MKKKELRNLAQKIADYEYILETSKDQTAINNAQKSIMQLTSKVKDFQDLDILDEMIQEILQSKLP